MEKFSWLQLLKQDIPLIKQNQQFKFQEFRSLKVQIHDETKISCLTWDFNFRYNNSFLSIIYTLLSLRFLSRDRKVACKIPSWISTFTNFRIRVSEVEKSRSNPPLTRTLWNDHASMQLTTYRSVKDCTVRIALQTVQLPVVFIEGYTKQRVSNVSSN